MRHLTVAWVSLALLSGCRGSVEPPSTVAPLDARPTSSGTVAATFPATPTAASSPIATPLASPPGAGTPPSIRGGAPRPASASPAAVIPDPRVTAVLARDITSDFRPVDPTVLFRPDSPAIYLVFTVKGLAPGTRLESIWIAERLGADTTVPANYEVDRAAVEIHRDGNGHFSLSRPDGGFPTGSYRVDLYREETLIGTFPFAVR